MSLLPSDLFQLVQSLSKAEKSYLSKLAGAANQGYMMLLADLEKAKDYDEKAFLKKHAQKPYAKNFRFSKHYLYQFILDGLQAMHREASTTAKLMGWVQKADILFSKALHQQAFNLLEKTVAQCEERELFAIAMECYERQYRIIYKGGYQIGNPEVSRHICQRQIVMAEKLLEYCQVTELHNNLMVLLRNKGNDVQKHQAEVQATLAQVLQAKPQPNAPIKTQVQWYGTMATGCFASQNHEGALVYQLALVNLYSQNPTLAAEEPYNQLSAINNLVMLQLELGKVVDIEATLALFDPYLQLLKQPKPTHTAIKAAESAYNLRLRNGLTYGTLTDAFVKQEVLPFLEAYGKQIAVNQKLNFHLHLAFYHCLHGRYAEAHDALLPVLHELPKDIRTDLHLQARMVELMIHYQLGHHDLLPYLQEAIYRKAHGKYKEMMVPMRAYLQHYLADKPAAAQKLRTAMAQYQAQCTVPPYIIEQAVIHWAGGL